MTKPLTHTNTFIFLLALVFVGVACYLQWELIASHRRADQAQTAYRTALRDYRHRNIYYDPEATIAWLRERQHPAGYFVPNPDLMFEPSQRNANTLRATRYAVATLRELNALDRINGRAVVEFVLSNHVPDVTTVDPSLDLRVYRHDPYAAFRTLEGETVGVRPTMDALIILDSLGALDDPRIDLERIERFILAHQNPDGGFWDEHYPEQGRASSMKCTSFALRGLGVIHRHTGKPFPQSFARRVAGFVERSRDTASGGYGAAPALPARDLYNVFRAFVTLWWLGGGDQVTGKAWVNGHMDVDRALDYARREHYLADQGAYSRFRSRPQRRPSLKASHLLVWMATAMGRRDRLDTEALIRFAASQESRPGEYGGDIYSTYSATGIFRKLDARTAPLPEPTPPPHYQPPFPAYFPPLFFVLALVTLTLGFFARRQELEAINRALARQAATDGLTGAVNRLRFEQVLASEIQRARRHGTPLSVILLDADHFKTVNDTHGHLGGDRVLKRLAEIIEAELREPDLLARWGGEEFVILAPGTDLQGACQLAEKLRRRIERATFNGGCSLTCSFGVAAYRSEESPEGFVERADQALYRAKRAGRNRVCLEGRSSQTAACTSG